MVSTQLELRIARAGAGSCTFRKLSNEYVSLINWHAVQALRTVLQLTCTGGFPDGRHSKFAAGLSRRLATAMLGSVWQNEGSSAWLASVE